MGALVCKQWEIEAKTLQQKQKSLVQELERVKPSGIVDNPLGINYFLALIYMRFNFFRKKMKSHVQE